MKQSKRIINTLSTGICVFFITLSISFIAYLYIYRNEPILYRSQDGANDWYATVFIQNPFRDETTELIADNFLSSIKGKTVTEALEENKDVDFTDPKIRLEKGKLIKWEMWNRFDSENETKFSYAIYREDELYKPKRGNFLLSFVFLTLERKGSEWKVKKYFCHATSNNS